MTSLSGGLGIRLGAFLAVCLLMAVWERAAARRTLILPRLDEGRPRGAPPLAFLLFEVLLNATAMFNHGNLSLPPALDRVLRLVVETPDMHRVHHSVVPGETNSNFGFNLPWWDRILGAYRDRPAAGHDGMTIGLARFQEERRETLPWLLLLPFRRDAGRHPNGRGGSRGAETG